MHYHQIITIIPALITIIWAISVKIKDRKAFDILTLSVCAIAVIANGLAEFYNVKNHGVFPNWLHFIQIEASSCIVPLAYMYFSRQMGRKLNNATAIVCWLLIVLTFFPNINFFIGDVKFLGGSSVIKTFSFNIIKDGAIVFSCHIADIVILLQALLTVLRMIPTINTLKTYGLVLTSRMMGFFMWWIGAVIFIAVTSFIPTSMLVSPVGSWIYYISYTILICSIFTMLALRFDLNPVVTVDQREVVDIDEFIDANKKMAQKLRTMMEEGKVYTQSGYSAEDAATELGTNRTYFSRMMNAEFGMKFSDLVTEYRIRHAKELLTTTDQSVADIAFLTGFSDASYMNKKFHQIVGVTPRVYREEHSASADQSVNA